MAEGISRRGFLGVAVRVAGAFAVMAALTAGSGCARPDEGFDFLLLGDVHFDQMSDHDMEWLQREKPGVIPEVKAYCRITEENTPLLFAELRRQVAANKRIAFVEQLGDLTEGLAGSPQLARNQHSDAVKFVRDAKLGVPFLLTIGNHDRNGPGAVEAFDAVLRPFISEQLAELRRRQGC